MSRCVPSEDFPQRSCDFWEFSVNKEYNFSSNKVNKEYNFSLERLNKEYKFPPRIY